VNDLLKSKLGILRIAAAARGVAFCPQRARADPPQRRAMHRASRKTARESAFRDSRENPVLASADETRSLRA
jgi:hypothetical protein